jgi:hypothetical protein
VETVSQLIFVRRNFTRRRRRHLANTRRHFVISGCLYFCHMPVKTFSLIEKGWYPTGGT